MYCSKCGTKAIDGAVFCQKCGAKLFQNNRDEQEPVSVPKQESEEMSNPAVKTISVSEQKSVKEEESSFKGKSVSALASGPVKTATVPTELIMKTVQEADAHEESSATSGSDADIYTLLKENIDKYPVIKSAKQFKKCVRLRGKIYNHTVRLVTVHAVQARIRSLLAFPFSILYGVLAGLLCFTIGIILAELMKYGSICIEYYHGILFALCCLVMGAVVLIHSCVGCKEKAAVAAYVREIVEPKRIYLSDRRRAGAIRIRVVAAVVLVVAGIIALPFSIPDPIEYPDELLFDGLPAARFLEMTQKDVEAEFGEKEPIKNSITADDYYNYTYDGFDHVTYSKETGKVIYIELRSSHCSYNQKDLDKSIERILDILSGGYWSQPMRYAYWVYGSIHSGFYYSDGVYFGDTLDVAEVLAQQEFEESQDYQYRFYPLYAYGEEDYNIALITFDRKYKDDPQMLYKVCIYTDEWIETVNATDVSLDQTIMDSNTSTSGETADDSVFGEALMQLIMYNTLPDGSVANDLDGKVDGIYDRFAICDIDQDGEKELLVNIASGSMSAAGIHIYGVNAMHTGLDYVWSFETDVTFYDTGFVKEEWSHNQGLANNFWPYSIYQRTDEGYSEIGSADDWEKSYMEFDFDGNPFPDEVDLNGNGIIYFISDENGIDYNNPVDDAEYKEFEKEFFGNADDLYVPWQSLELDNVEAFKYLTNDNLTETTGAVRSWNEAAEVVYGWLDSHPLGWETKLDYSNSAIVDEAYPIYLTIEDDYTGETFIGTISVSVTDGSMIITVPAMDDAGEWTRSYDYLIDQWYSDIWMSVGDV